MALTWENLYFRVPSSICCLPIHCFGNCMHGNIVSNLNGKIELGKMVALLGPSGSGKTTVLKCLTQGKSLRGFSDGQILVDNKERALTSYICQRDMDHLLVSLTVEESLLYASQLKNPRNADHGAIINEQIGQLGLGRVRRNVVAKLSGGECKRLVVGLELTSNPKPNYLLLDEPTSGLDSLAVLELLDTLSALVTNKPMAVVTVIHQPSYEALLKYDQVYFLSKAGNFIYGGSPGVQILQYIEEHGYYGKIAPAIAHENPADIMIKIASAASRVLSNTNATVEEVKDADIEADIKDRTPLEKICEAMANTYQATYLFTREDPSQLVEVHQDGLCKNSSACSFKNLWILLKRTARSTILGQPVFLLIRFALHAIIAFMLAALHNRELGKADSCYTKDPRFNFIRNGSCTMSDKELLGLEEPVTEQNIKFQFFSLLFQMFASLMPTVLSYSSEIKVFLNEHRNGWYTTSTYYIAKTLTEIPFQIIFPFFYTWFLYWYTSQIGMDAWYGGVFGFMSWRYQMFLTILIIACFTAQGLGFLIGILCINSSNTSILLSCSSLIFLFLFSGFFVKIAEMAPEVEWVTYTSFVRFALQSLVILLYGQGRCGLIPLPGETEPTIPTSSAVLYAFDLHDSELWRNIYWLVGHLLVIRLAAFIGLKCLADPKLLNPSFNFKCKCVSFKGVSFNFNFNLINYIGSKLKLPESTIQDKGFREELRELLIKMGFLLTLILVCIGMIIWGIVLIAG